MIVCDWRGGFFPSDFTAGWDFVLSDFHSGSRSPFHASLCDIFLLCVIWHGVADVFYLIAYSDSEYSFAVTSFHVAMGITF